jgi:hypothetical protein
LSELGHGRLQRDFGARILVPEENSVQHAAPGPTPITAAYD